VIEGMLANNYFIWNLKELSPTNCFKLKPFDYLSLITLFWLSNLVTIITKDRDSEFELRSLYIIVFIATN